MRHETKGITMTAVTTAAGDPDTREGRAVRIRYKTPGQFNGIVRFPFGSGENDFVETGGWTQSGDVFTAPDGTRWDFTGIKVIPGARGAVTYSGWLISARPLISAADAEHLPDPVDQLRAAEALIREAHPAVDPAWEFWHHVADLLNYAASIAADMTGDRPPMTWSRWNRIVGIARGYLAVSQLPGAGTRP